jgi:hypothetical protein
MTQNSRHVARLEAARVALVVERRRSLATAARDFVPPADHVPEFSRPRPGETS